MNLDPIPQVWVDDPHDVYRELREKHPVYHVEERDLWVISRYDDIQMMLRSPERFSSASGVVPSGYAPESPTIITTDPPIHTAIPKQCACVHPQADAASAGHRLSRTTRGNCRPQVRRRVRSSATLPYRSWRAAGSRLIHRTCGRRCGDVSDSSTPTRRHGERERRVWSSSPSPVRVAGKTLTMTQERDAQSTPDADALAEAEVVALCF